MALVQDMCLLLGLHINLYLTGIGISILAHGL